MSPVAAGVTGGSCCSAISHGKHVAHSSSSTPASPAAAGPTGGTGGFGGGGGGSPDDCLLTFRDPDPRKDVILVSTTSAVQHAPPCVLTAQLYQSCSC
jgi:hypothetical protein